MKVLMITGDANLFVPGTEANRRLQLQRSQVETLEAVYWGKGSLLPRIPGGRFDVVTVQDPFWRGLFAWFIARIKKAKLNIQVHTDFDEETRSAFLRRMVGKMLLRAADSIRTVSNRIKGQIEKYTKIPVAILPVFVDAEKIWTATSADLQTPYPQFTHRILMAGRLETEKNVMAAICAMPVIRKKFPGAGLFIAGKGSQKKALAEEGKKLGVEKNIIFLGYRTDLPSLYKGVDMLLVTSSFESYGMSMIEALTAGIPVVAPDVGVAREAGAIVSENWIETVMEVLRTKPKGKLLLPLLSAQEWAQAWKKTLL